MPSVSVPCVESSVRCNSTIDCISVSANYWQIIMRKFYITRGRAASLSAGTALKLPEDESGIITVWECIYRYPSLLLRWSEFTAGVVSKSKRMFCVLGGSSCSQLNIEKIRKCMHTGGWRYEVRGYATATHFFPRNLTMNNSPSERKSKFIALHGWTRESRARIYSCTLSRELFTLRITETLLLGQREHL